LRVSKPRGRDTHVGPHYAVGPTGIGREPGADRKAEDRAGQGAELREEVRHSLGFCRLFAGSKLSHFLLSAYTTEFLWAVTAHCI
jgi:hypothetical protein